jgi:predicted transposase/invertase (TIGR01784 family)
MRRDTIFYRLFSIFPPLLFAILDDPPPNPNTYTFNSVAVKEPTFIIDGVFLPPEDQPGPVYFCEAQVKKDDRLYERIMAESMPYFYRNRDRLTDWRVIVIYPRRSREQQDTRPFQELLDSDRIHRIYLNELGAIDRLPIPLALLVLTIQSKRKTPVAAREVLQRIPKEHPNPRESRAIIEVLTAILSYRFTQSTRKEVEAMLGLTVKEEPRFFRDIKAEGQLRVLLVILQQKFGNLTPETIDRLDALTMEQLDIMTPLVLQWQTHDELVAWLDANG